MRTQKIFNIFYSKLCSTLVTACVYNGGVGGGLCNAGFETKDNKGSHHHAPISFTIIKNTITILFVSVRCRATTKAKTARACTSQHCPLNCNHKQQRRDKNNNSQSNRKTARSKPRDTMRGDDTPPCTANGNCRSRLPGRESKTLR